MDIHFVTGKGLGNVSIMRILYRNLWSIQAVLANAVNNYVERSSECRSVREAAFLCSPPFKFHRQRQACLKDLVSLYNNEEQGMNQKTKTSLGHASRLLPHHTIYTPKDAAIETTEGDHRPQSFDDLLNAVDEETVCTEHSSAIDEVHHCDPVTQADNEPFLVEASTMTEDSVETSKLLFFCCEKDGDGTATQIESVPTVDVGTACPGVQYGTKGTGTIYKEVYFGGYKSIVDDEQRLLDLTGVTLVILAILRSLLPDRCRHPRELDINDKLILFLMKMKHGLPFSCLASLFGIHRTTAAKIFKSILLKLCAATRSWLFWPSRAAIRATMPPSISLLYPNCRVIIDCTELKAETPPGVEAQNMWYSHYKGTYTIKYLVGIAPNGLVTFLSPGFGGRANDTSVTVEAGVLPLLEPGDLVLADKGFPGIRTGVGQQGATLVMPPFATKPQFTEAEADATYDTASVRIHVERVIQRLRIFDILNTRIPQELAMYMDKIMHIVCVLTNLRPGIFRKVQPTVDDTQ
ncbi:uncharacterized protein LOC135382911 [Ornithodoros turicata]|uniref:uncharacterized protein LOC135382911 n=1 Tax=Ornithodoros turicata TaxID=34597 RepID=UPI003139349A